MALTKTIGGDRLGSGNQMKAELHNYERSTHDLSQVTRTTAAPGLLIPIYKKLALTSDTWSIDLSAMVRTMPAIGPLFGSFKLQVDFFKAALRLYNGVLHNNWVKIGLDMSKVKLPKMRMKTNATDGVVYDDWNSSQISQSSLWAYMGLRGIGGVSDYNNKAVVSIQRDVNCVPILAYYDIFKNYYANKQEKNAYIIASDAEQNNARITKVQRKGRKGWINIKFENQNPHNATFTDTYHTIQPYEVFRVYFDGTISWNSNSAPTITVMDGSPAVPTQYALTNTSLFDRIVKGDGYFEARYKGLLGLVWLGVDVIDGGVSDEKIKIQEFDLENIDKMRQDILKATGLNNQFLIQQQGAYLPYSALCSVTTEGFSKSRSPMAGLALKTYQSDIYNCWLSREWIDGINGINAITSVDTSSGSFTIDSLQLSKKIYDMLNRIAVSGGTYQDWLEAAYGDEIRKLEETPVYVGGMSGEIAFEEVVSTADTATEAAGDQPLGTLGGKGTLVNSKNGHIEIHIDEPSYIIGIMSITPRIDYSQGNDFDITELDSVNDIHKPALDGIGFQNLMLERMVWWGKEWNEQLQTWGDNVVGKIPAWLEYMTSVNQLYGGFAKTSDLGWMTLARNYQHGQSLLNGTSQYIPITDFTTYINPTKFNYAFADTRLNAQNFWVQIGVHAISRRKMSAKLLPYL